MNHTSENEKGLKGSAESQSWAKLPTWQKFILLTNCFIYNLSTFLITPFLSMAVAQPCKN